MANETTWDDFDLDDPKTGLDPDTQDDDPIEPVIPGNDFDDPDVPDNGAGEPVIPVNEPVKDGDVEGTENLSGIEMYLSQFDIEGGIINLEDGTTKHFTELSAEEQSLVLQQLHDTNAQSIEEKYGLGEDEIAFLNYTRQNNMDVQTAIETLAQERVNTILVMQESSSADYTNMGDDAVYSLFLQKSNPEATAEQIEQDLEKAKSMSNFTKVTEKLRGQFIAEQASEVARQAQARAQENAALIEEQRKQVVDVVVPLKEISGIPLNDAVKNSVLDRVLEVDKDGDSLFLSEVFSDPEKLFKAAFWFYYGDKVIQARDDHWKKEKSAAYSRGRQEAVKGAPSTPITFKANQASKATPSNYDSLDDLHE